MNPDPYPTLRQKIHQTLLLGQRQIEQAKVLTYWNTGKLIQEHLLKNGDRADYGHQVVEKLSRDLGVGITLLRRCVQFYRSFKIGAPAHQSAPRLTWSHYVELSKIPDESTRLSLMKRAQEADWSRDELIGKIRSEVRDEAAENGAHPAQSFRELAPRRGTLYTYRLIPGRAQTDQLWLDLGFQISRVAGSSKEFKEGQIVETRKKEELYILRKSERGEKDLFTYSATVERVVDGDTLRVEIDLGFGIYLREYLRLRGIDAPELSTPEGKKAKAFVEKTLPRSIVLTSTRDDKYGRYLADVFYDDRGKEVYLNQRLLDERMAERYQGGARPE